jgi:hypothetical protein
MSEWKKRTVTECQVKWIFGVMRAIMKSYIDNMHPTLSETRFEGPHAND